MMQARKFLWATGLLLVVSTTVPGAEAATSKTSKTKVKLCQKDADRLCQNLDQKSIANCLFSPENRTQLAPKCRQALEVRRKKTLAACEAVVELVCKKEAQSGLLLGPCLAKRINDPGFPDECKARLAQIPNEPKLWEASALPPVQ